MNKAPLIDGLEEVDSSLWIKQQRAELRAVKLERQQAVKIAVPALERICAAMCGRSGQAYKLRNLLFSLWNGKPAPLIDLLELDWSLRKDFLFVCAAFGYEDAETQFFYDSVATAMKAAGQWTWFVQEIENVRTIEDYVRLNRRGA